MFATRPEARDMMAGLYFSNPYGFDRVRRLVLFHPHTEYFDFIGLPSRPPAEFMRAVREAAPTVEVDAVEPGRRTALELGQGLSA